MRRQQGQDWTARWIWGIPGHAFEQRNSYCYLRKVFTLKSEPVAASARVTADNRYQLFVNGTFVCRGPARCEPKRQAFDEVDLAPFLRKGRNVVAALAHHFGESTMQSLERGGFGFLLDAEVRCRSGRPVPIHTDDTWKGIPAAGYSRRTSRYNVHLGFQEDLDAARVPAGWTTVSYHDAHWPPACVHGPAGRRPYEHLEPRSIPFSRELPAQFLSVVSMWTGRHHPDYLHPDNLARIVMEERRSPARVEVFRDAAAALRPGRSAMTVLPTSTGRHHAIVLDAGQEAAGFVRLDLEAVGGEIIDVFCCEHVRGRGEPALGPAQALPLGLFCDRYRCRPGRQQHQFFSWKGFRYLLVIFRDVHRPMKVHHIGYTSTTYPVERAGSFECSDPLLNRIWETGVRTQQLCMHDAYVDCPWREQAQWWGDARVQWRVNWAVFGDAALFRRGLRQIAQSQIDNGLTYGVFPCEMHGLILPDYTLVWVCSLWDYYLYTGDEAPVREHFDAVVRAMNWFEPQARRRGGLLGHPGGGLWLFLDWSPLYRGDASATFTFQYLEALRTAARLAALVGRRAEQRRWLALARQVERAILRAFWDATGKRFFEGYDFAKRLPVPQVGQHANALAILNDVQPRWHPQIADRIAWILRHHNRLLTDNTGHYYHARARHPVASPFFYAYVLEAMLKAGRGGEALAGIRRLWGGMLDRGATTWFETWNHHPESYGESSACHAWSASPTYHLSEQVGGVRPVAPGFSEVSITPRMFDLAHADVRTPTPRGTIAVTWHRQGKDGIRLKLRLPRRITADLRLPDGSEHRLAGGSHTFTA